MATEKEFDHPFAIATLTQPIEGSQGGRIQSSGVYGLSGSRKRKRAEIVVSSDGEGIHIYNVQTSRVVASYAVPPQASFTTAPCCVYRRPSKSSPARRCTYTSTVQALNGRASPQILCFDEESEPGSLGNIRKLNFDISKDRSNVLIVDFLPTAGGDHDEGSDYQVLVIYQDGKFDCLSADLKTLLWSSDLLSILPSNVSPKASTVTTVRYAYLCNALSASRGLFKGRDDILAILRGNKETDPEVFEGTPVLVLATTSTGTNDIILHALSLRPALRAGLTSRGAIARYLVSWSLPQAADPKKLGPSNFSIQADAGTVTYLTPNGLVAYELQHTVPKETTQFSSPDGLFSSFLRLTPSLALAVSDSCCGLFDLTYQTLQAALRFGDPALPHGIDKKRPRGVVESSMRNVTFIGYFSALDLAVGSTSTELIGFPLGSILPRKRGKRDGGLLIDSIGKGLKSCLQSPIGHRTGGIGSSNTGTNSKKSTESISRLDNYVEQDDIVGFEGEFAHMVGITRDTTDYDAWSRSHTNGTNTAHKVNGIRSSQDNSMEIDKVSDDQAPLPTWTFPEQFDPRERFKTQPLALYALSKLFSWAPDHGDSGSFDNSPAIAADFYAPNVFRYLLMTECLNKDIVQRALRMYSGVPSDLRVVNEGDIVAALVDLDPSFGILHYVLNSGSYLSIGEIVWAIKLIIQRLDTQLLSELTSRFMSNGDSAVNAEDAIDNDFEKAIMSMSDAIDHAQSTLDNAPSTRGDIPILTYSLQAALTTLHSFPKTSVITKLRSVLTHHELFFLMNLLRIQLRSGGWASRYFDTDASEMHSDSESPSDSAILIITSLLSSVLDTIGTGGWLLASQHSEDPDVPSAFEDKPDEMIRDLHEDITAVVEGIHEVTFMGGLLSEFLRFHYRGERHRKKATNARKQAQKKPYQVMGGDSMYGDADARILPLGLVVKEAPSLTKTKGSGQEVEKSMRQIGYELSKLVPKYSVERIDI